jgi:hypothetical protein
MDQPALPDLLRVVREYLEHVQDQVPDRERYHALCCAYLLAVAEREVTQGRALADASAARIAGYLGMPPGGGASRALADALRAGRLDEDWDGAFALVLAQVVDKVRISRPDYLDPMHREAST